jgi:hypothetical protein
MAVKTFTTGEVLTAADTNTYLNNGGLVYIGATTIGSAVSSVVVSSVFSSTYDNYRIVVNVNSQSADGYARIQFNNDTGSVYYDVATEIVWQTATLNAVASAASTTGRLGRYSATFGNWAGSFDIYKPNAATRTFLLGQSGAPGYFWTTGLQVAADTANTGFTLSPSTGTWTNGTIRVYGYRQA